jgi:hypothetical protein
MTIWFAHISGLKTETARAKTSVVGSTDGTTGISALQITFIGGL